MDEIFAGSQATTLRGAVSAAVDGSSSCTAGMCKRVQCARPGYVSFGECRLKLFTLLGGELKMPW